MSFWFKYSVNPSYTIQQINYYSVGISAVQIVSALSFAWVSDYALKGKRWPPLVSVAVSLGTFVMYCDQTDKVTAPALSHLCLARRLACIPGAQGRSMGLVLPIRRGQLHTRPLICL